MEKKVSIQLSKEELYYLSHILRHFTDYMAFDDRHDHGLGILKGYREMQAEDKSVIYMLSGKLTRKDRKVRSQNLK